MCLVWGNDMLADTSRHQWIVILLLDLWSYAWAVKTRLCIRGYTVKKHFLEPRVLLRLAQLERLSHRYTGERSLPHWWFLHFTKAVLFHPILILPLFFVWICTACNGWCSIVEHVKTKLCDPLDKRQNKKYMTESQRGAYERWFCWHLRQQWPLSSWERHRADFLPFNPRWSLLVEKCFGEIRLHLWRKTSYQGLLAVRYRHLNTPSLFFSQKGAL